MRTQLFSLLFLSLCAGVAARSRLSAEGPTQFACLFAEEIDRRLDVPEAEKIGYGSLLAELLAERDIGRSQYLVLVDRSEFIQAAMIYWVSPGREFQFIGASPVSTGKPGSFDHFKTPTGIFEHTVDNPDFRAEGTRNEFGIRGYGERGMRVYDFGWQKAEKGWGRGGSGVMRLQMHATDPDFLEKRLGSAQSKGCIRIPASLNVFIDRHGILDADYEEASAKGKTFWVLSKDRRPGAEAGRLLVVVDTARKARPAWSPNPLRRR